MTVGQIVMFYHYGCEIQYGKPKKLDEKSTKEMTKEEKDYWIEREMKKYYSPEELERIQKMRGKK